MNFTVYKSSAGSGKTFTLVKEYLKLALSDELNPPQKYRHILAITFTNKAAAEMKERIIKALKELSDPENKNTVLLNLLIEETGLNESKIRARADLILHTILHNYSDFGINTIDSFVHRIVRTFAYDLQLPVNFEIEMDDEKLLSQVIDLLISQTGSDESLTKALVEFTELKAADEKSWHIEQDLFKFSKNLLTEEGVIHLEYLKNISTSDFLKIRSRLNETIKKFENSIQKIAEGATDHILKQGLEHKDFYQGRSGISVYFNNLSSGNFEKLKPNSYVLKTINESKWYTDKTTEDTQDKIDSIKEQLSQYFHSIHQIREQQESIYNLFKLINRNIYSLAVLNEIEKLLSELKKQNNILHISEFNKIISKIVLNQPIPFVYERIGEKYNHYLIDEFQDTSVLQWQNLLPLVENTLAEGNFSMLVGDSKQAIYRWRGGEVEQFSQLPNVFLKEKNEFVIEREQTLIRNYSEKQLNKNFRSKKEIIEFNNSLFSVLTGKLKGTHQNIYKNLEQQANPDNTGGYVSVNFMQGEDDELEELTLEQTLNTIISLQADQYKLNDIAILCRNNRTGNLIAEYLTGKGIKVLSTESLLLKNSAKIALIISVFNYLDQPENEITRVELLQYMVENNLIKGTIHELGKSIKGKRAWEFDALLKQNGFELNHQLLIKLPLYELIEQLVKLFHLGTSADANVQFFMDEVLSYSIKNNNNLNDFINWWEKRKEKASMNIPEGTDAVTIMTIHRSKGLEFPAIILPFADWKTIELKDDLWVDLVHNEVPEMRSALLPPLKELKETAYAALYEEEQNKSLLDNINLLYVALTRPEERLYILTNSPSKEPEKLSRISDVLCHYLQNQGLWSENQFDYFFGNKTTHQQKNKKEKTSVKQRNIRSNEWRDILKIRANAPEVWETGIELNKKDFGLLVHAILAKIRTAEDLHSVLTQFMNEGIIDNKENAELLVKLKRILENKELKKYYSAGNEIKSEMEILLPNGESYRPDRVVIANGITTIIDYKTGIKSDKHIKQINKYAELLAQMGYSGIEQFLVYIEEEEVVKV